MFHAQNKWRIESVDILAKMVIELSVAHPIKVKIYLQWQKERNRGRREGRAFQYVFVCLYLHRLVL